MPRKTTLQKHHLHLFTEEIFCLVPTLFHRIKILQFVSYVYLSSLKYVTHMTFVIITEIIGVSAAWHFATSNNSPLDYNRRAPKSMNNTPVRVINTCRLQETFLGLNHPRPIDAYIRNFIQFVRPFFLKLIHPSALRKCFLSHTFCISPCWQQKVILKIWRGRRWIDMKGKDVMVFVSEVANVEKLWTSQFFVFLTALSIQGM